MGDIIEVPRDLMEKLAKDPDYLKKAQRAVSQSNFKETYKVTNASGLRCPACSQFGTNGASLWWDSEYPTRFVCRKCFRIWIITCDSENLEDVIAEIKKK